MDKKFAYFLGVLHDAHIICRPLVSQYGFEIEQKNKNYAEYLTKIIFQLFGIKPKLELRKRSWGYYWRIRVYSKKIYKEIAKHDFKKLLRTQTKLMKRELIRGFYDAEGSISSDEVRMFNKDKELLEIMGKIISKDFGLRIGKVVVSKDDVFQLPIYAKLEQRKFMKIFKPNHPDKVLS